MKTNTYRIPGLVLTDHEFAVPLEDPSLRWLVWEKGSHVPFTLPSPGQTVGLQPFSF